MPPVDEEPTDKSKYRIIGAYKYKEVCRYVDANYPFPTGQDKLDKYKVFIPRALDAGFDMTKERLHPVLGLPNDACTEKYLVIGPYDDESTANNVISYINTKFFHMLMFLKKVSQDVSSKVYTYVPVQDFSKSWTDAELYDKYGLTQDEIDFIESMIKPME